MIAQGNSSFFESPRVLLVDDDRGYLNETREQLEKAGYRVYIESGCESALRLVADVAIHIAVVNYRLSDVLQKMSSRVPRIAVLDVDQRNPIESIPAIREINQNFQGYRLADEWIVKGSGQQLVRALRDVVSANYNTDIRLRNSGELGELLAFYRGIGGRDLWEIEIAFQRLFHGWGNSTGIVVQRVWRDNPDLRFVTLHLQVFTASGTQHLNVAFGEISQVLIEQPFIPHVIYRGESNHILALATKSHITDMVRSRFPHLGNGMRLLVKAGSLIAKLKLW